MDTRAYNWLSGSISTNLRGEKDATLVFINEHKWDGFLQQAGSVRDGLTSEFTGQRKPDVWRHVKN